jgi:hypothetical protein
VRRYRSPRDCAILHAVPSEPNEPPVTFKIPRPAWFACACAIALIASANAGLAQTNVPRTVAPGGQASPLAAPPITSDPSLPPAPNPELDRLFQAVMANPGDVQANMAYGRAAERAGLIRKALAAYERVVTNHPDNAEARAAYARLSQQTEPASTRWRVSLGTLLESNSSTTNGRSPATNPGRRTGGPTDGAAVSSIRVTDDRNIGGQRWRTNGLLYGELHAKDRSTDFDQVGIETGPQYVLDNGWLWRPQLSLETGFLNYGYLFSSVGLISELQFKGLDPVRSSRLQFSRVKFDEGDKTRDAWVLAGRTEFAWEDVGFKGAFVSVEPFFAWYRAESFTQEERYWSYGFNASYGIPVAQGFMGFARLYAIPEFSVEMRPYSGRETMPAAVDKGNRSDWRIVPGLKFVGTQFMELPLTAVLAYDYDRTRSNYNAYDYDNHRVMLTFVYEF